MRKVLTHDLREIFRRCKFRFDLQQQGVKGNIDSKTRYFRLLGKATEEAVDCKSRQEQTAVFLHHIQQLPVLEQQAARVEVDCMVTRSRELTSSTTNKTAKVKRQEQYKWVDNEPYTPSPDDREPPPLYPNPTFFTFYAKPDLVVEDWDAHGKIIRIVDEKIAERVRSKDRRNLYFFGFVASKQFAREQAQAWRRGESYEMPSIQLVVRALRSPGVLSVPEEVFWYKRAREKGSLQEYRKDIADMLEAERLGLFPASIDWDCGRCPFGKMVDGDPMTIICEAYRNQVLKQQQQAEDADTVA